MTPVIRLLLPRLLSSAEPLWGLPSELMSKVCVASRFYSNVRLSEVASLMVKERQRRSFAAGLNHREGGLRDWTEMAASTLFGLWVFPITAASLSAEDAACGRNRYRL
jgi:hypothetical protein